MPIIAEHGADTSPAIGDTRAPWMMPESEFLHQPAPFLDFARREARRQIVLVTSYTFTLFDGNTLVDRRSPEVLDTPPMPKLGLFDPMKYGPLFIGAN